MPAYRAARPGLAAPAADICRFGGHDRPCCNAANRILAQDGKSKEIQCIVATTPISRHDSVTPLSRKIRGLEPSRSKIAEQRVKLIY
jgi:hypothetical protein